MIPVEFGGFGASISDVADICYTLGRACASTAMIYAMHQTKVACVVRHGHGSAWHGDLMRRVAAEQLLLASSTTEGQSGGNVRSSAAAVDTPATRVIAGARRHRDLLRRAGRRHRHHRPPRHRRRRVRPGAAGVRQGRLHARSRRWAGKRSACAAPAATGFELKVDCAGRPASSRNPTTRSTPRP